MFKSVFKKNPSEMMSGRAFLGIFMNKTTNWTVSNMKPVPDDTGWLFLVCDVLICFASLDVARVDLCYFIILCHILCDILNLFIKKVQCIHSIAKFYCKNLK